MHRWIIAALLSLASLPTWAQAPAAEYAAVFAEAAKLKFPDNRPITIAFHGHSVPAGYMAGGVVDTMRSYPMLLLADLKTVYPYAQINVLVSARPGETSEEGAQRFQQVLSAKPDVVVLDYALNDRTTGSARASAALSSMAEQARAAGALVILMTPTPDLAFQVEKLADQAAMIRTLARTIDVGLCDAAAAFRGLDVKSLMAESNHPNGAGHQIVARTLRAHFVPPQVRQADRRP